MSRNVGRIIACAVLVLSLSTTAYATTLDEVKKKGFLACGVSQGYAGFSIPDDKGNWTGFDVDFCRAVAAATLGDADKVKYIPLSAKERMTALQAGEIDMLSRNTTWTFTRDSALGLDFAAINLYDGQSYMVRKDLGVKSALDLDGATVCTNAGTSTERTTADYFRANGMRYVPVIFEKNDEVVAAYDKGRCDVYTTDRGVLASQRTKLKNPDAHVILPEITSKEPLGPLVRHGDNQWKDIVAWSVFAVINAEELDINSRNVKELSKTSKDPSVQRLLGTEGKLGAKLGLSNAWAYDIVAQVGNYGEIWDRSLGVNSPLKLERGLNALWTKNGILYAPPVR